MPVLALDNTFNIIYWNKSAEEMFGWHKDEVIGKNSDELLQTKIENSSHELDIKKMQQKGKYGGEAYYLHRDGHYIPVEVGSTYQIDENGKFKGIFTSIKDITERKIIEDRNKQLLEHEQQLTEELTVSNEELQSTTEELQVTNEELLRQGNELLEINKSLKVSEERFHTLADNIPNLAWMAIRMVGFSGITNNGMNILEQHQRRCRDGVGKNYIIPIMLTL